VASRPAVLVIAGSDSSGGAGLARDVRTLEMMGTDALCAVTAVTAQTDAAVLGVYPVAAEQVRLQIEAAFATRRVGAVKIGMLVGPATIDAVADALQSSPSLPRVLDPVLRTSSGAALLEEGGLGRLRARLFPLATLLTPNIPEAACLAGESGATDPEPARLVGWARRLLAEGAGAVLIKGGHASGDVAADVLVRPDAAPLWLSGPRLSAGRRGTGCALAAAIAAALAAGADLPEACRLGRAHVLALLAEAQAGAPAAPGSDGGLARIGSE
jgi:hydroxymethylpyrimidine/phosphomethylpyrimidine kinase